MNFQSLNSATPNGFSIGIFGDGGVGKTTLLGSIPEDKLLYISIEGGEDTIRQYSNPRVHVPPKPTPKEPFCFKDSLDEVYTYLRTEKHDFSFIAIDSASELEKYFQFMYAFSMGKDIASLREYGQASEIVYKYITQFRDLKNPSNNACGRPINTIFILLEFPLEINRTEGGEITTKISPLLTKKLSSKVTAMVDVMTRLEVSTGGQRSLRFQPTANVTAKTRFNCLPALLPMKDKSFSFYNEVVIPIGKEIMSYKRS